MAINKASSAENTDMSNVVTDFSINPASETGDATWQIDWTKWLGFYKSVPDLQSSIDKKAFWTVGNGYKVKKKSHEVILKKIKGNGKETFNTILYNGVRTYTVCGDFFAEIVRKNGKIVNLKALNPGSIEIVANKYGIITKYIQHLSTQQTRDAENRKDSIQEFKPEEIFHLCFNKIADDIHGIGTIEKLTNDDNAGIIEMQQEVMKDLKIVFQRYVKPLLISEIDEDDPTEVQAFKNKLDLAVKNGENMVIPKDTATVERVSIPQFSTLDPIPWLNHLDKLLIKAEGVPAIVLGDGHDSTEATAKILYLAFEQMIKWNQLFVEEAVLAQLGIEIELNFPASLSEGETDNVTTPEESNRKSRKIKNMEMKNGKSIK